jgi:hypothetical protein
MKPLAVMTDMTDMQLYSNTLSVTGAELTSDLLSVTSCHGTMLYVVVHVFHLSSGLCSLQLLGHPF